MSKISLEYVISALGATQIFSKSLYENHFDMLKEGLHSSMDILRRNIETYCKNTEPAISTLFNAYTEHNIIPRLKKLDNLGARAIYSDSGGLQIVTAGKQNTPEIKDKIYRIQAASDYAMCFDEIPLEKTTTVRTINERSNIGNKIFDQSRHGESGAQTGENIKKQIAVFRELKSKTKIIMIIQGNNAQDMLHYYQQIVATFNEEDYQYIGGMAVADTCLGNGELESIEMLKGARAISQVCHPNVAHHLHILGVGSIYRMRPILYLIKSGYLNTFNHVSYDSSSHTCTFRFGLLKLNGTCLPLGLVRTPEGESHFNNVYEYFSDYLKPKLTVDQFFDIILLDGKTPWSGANVKKNAEKLNEELKVVAMLGNMFHTYFQVGNFISCLDDVLTEKRRHDSIGYLRKVKTEEDMNSWFRDLKAHVNSRRIVRKENHATLLSLFGE